MKFVLEFVDKDKKTLNLTQEERDKALEEAVDRAMARIGFRRKQKTKA